MRFAKLWVLTLGIGSLLVLSAPPAHANCPLLDPDCLIDIVDDVTDVVDDTVEGVTDVVDDTVDDVTDVVDEVADGAGDVVDDTVGGVTDVVDDTVDVVEDTVNGGPEVVEDGTGVIEDTVDQGEETVKDVVGADEPPMPVPDPDGGIEAGRDQTPGGSGGGAFPRQLEPPAPPVSPVLQVPVPISTTGVSARRGAAPPDGPGLLDRLGGAAAAAARQLSFPIALSLIVVAFVLFQNYLDRKDPKLAVAPIAADVMKFE